jgi:hypothetical protein
MPGVNMRNFISTEERFYKKGEKYAKLQIGATYRSKRLLERAKVSPSDKALVLGKVDGDWEKFVEIREALMKNCKYEDGKIPQQCWKSVQVNYASEEELPVEEERYLSRVSRTDE